MEVAEQHHALQAGQQSSIYRGVTFNKKSRKWQSVLNVSGSHVHLGTFNSEEDAAVAFDKAALIVRGERARINFALANYLDASGRIIEDPVFKQKIDSSCDPNRTKRRPPAPRGSSQPATAGASVGPAALASSLPYLHALQAAQLTGAQAGQVSLPPYSLWPSTQHAAGPASTAFNMQQHQQGASAFPANANGGVKSEVPQLSAQSMLQMLNSIGMPSTSGAAVAPSSGSSGGVPAGPSNMLPGLSALSLPGQYQQQQPQTQLTDAVLGRIPSSSLYGASGDVAGAGPGSALYASNGQEQGTSAAAAAPVPGFWEVIATIARCLPDDAELKSVVPSPKAGQIGVVYQITSSGHWGACLLQGNQLTGHHVRPSVAEVMEYLDSLFQHLCQPMQGLLGVVDGNMALQHPPSIAPEGASDEAAAEAAAAAAAVVTPEVAAGTVGQSGADASSEALQNLTIQALLAAMANGGATQSTAFAAPQQQQQQQPQQQLQEQHSLSMLQSLLSNASGQSIAAALTAVQGSAGSLDGAGLLQIQRLASEVVRQDEGMDTGASTASALEQAGREQAAPGLPAQEGYQLMNGAELVCELEAAQHHMQLAQQEESRKRAAEEPLEQVQAHDSTRHKVE